MPTVRARARARVGLLGPPSEARAGRGLGFTLAELGVEVLLEPAPRFELPPGPLATCFERASEALRAAGVEPRDRPFALRSESDLPACAGLGEPSALLLAALAAFDRWYAAGWSPAVLADLVQRASGPAGEGGPLDTWVQLHGGLLALDCPELGAPAAVTALDPRLLPPLLIAWGPEPATGAPSGPSPGRWPRSDPRARRVLGALAENATRGRRALEDRDRHGFRDCVDRDLELHAERLELAPAERELIDLGRALGAGAKLCGSGGSVLFACLDEEHRERVERGARAAGYPTLRPTVALPPVLEAQVG
jgi:hypothetical protein